APARGLRHQREHNDASAYLDLCGGAGFLPSRLCGRLPIRVAPKGRRGECPRHPRPSALRVAGVVSAASQTGRGTPACRPPSGDGLPSRPAGIRCCPSALISPAPGVPPMTSPRSRAFLVLALASLVAAAGRAEEDLNKVKWVQSTAFVVPKETATEGEGYFSIIEGLNGRLYIGTHANAVNSWLVEFDPSAKQMKVVVDAHKAIGKD